MITAIKIKVNDKYVRNNFGKFIAQIPKTTDKMAYKVADIFRQEMYKQLQTAGHDGGPLDWEGDLIKAMGSKNSIVKVSQKKNEVEWGINMPIEGIYQEYMKPHWVSPIKWPSLKKWAEEKQWGDQPLGYIPPVLYVRPHPFIRPAVQQAAKRMRDYMVKNEDLDSLLNIMRG